VRLELDTLLVIVAAMAIGSFVKGATGAGLPQLAIPVMATFIGVEAAVVIMAIPGIVSNTWLLWTYRRNYKNTRDLPALLATGTVGAIVGTVLLDSLDEDVLSLVLAGIIVLYTIAFFASPDLRLPRNVTRYASPAVGLGAGLLQGATGISGPLVTTYLHGYRLEKETFVLSITTIFQFFALVQTVTLLAVGLYTTERFAFSVLSLLPIMAMLPLGARFTSRLSRKTFDRIVLALLLAAAVKLFYDGLS
jgi:uncharacterized protein